MPILNYCIFDTETNGLPNKNDFSNVSMTQIGIIITNGTKNFIEKEYLVKGDFNISNEITELTGITKEMTEKNGISFFEIWKDINYLLEKYKCSFIISHNNYFDLNVIKQEYRRLNNLTLNKQETFNTNDLKLENEIIEKINQFKIFDKNFLNKYKYNLVLLYQIYNFVSQATCNKYIIMRQVLYIIKTFNKNKKLYNDYFFQIIPLCSLLFFRKILPRNENMNNYKLQTIYNSLHDEVYEQQHRALDDCFVLQKCMKKINLNILDYISY